MNWQILHFTCLLIYLWFILVSIISFDLLIDSYLHCPIKYWLMKCVKAIYNVITYHIIDLFATLSCIFAGIVRASSVFPILSTCLLMLGGMCVGVGRVYNKTNNVLLSAGILFVAAGEQEDYTVSHVPSQEQSCTGWASIMKKGSMMWHLWSHIVLHQWCNHKKLTSFPAEEGQDLHSPHTSHISDEDTLRVLMRVL